MMKSDDGYSPKSGYLEGALKAIDDLRADTMPDYDFFELDQLLDSSDMAVGDWNRIGEVIATRYGEYDGFVILHGTDTMS